MKINSLFTVFVSLSLVSSALSAQSIIAYTAQGKNSKSAIQIRNQIIFIWINIMGPGKVNYEGC